MKSLSAFLDSFLEKGVPGYDCIVYQDGKQIFRKYDGFADVNTKAPLSGKEKYFLYSCSKPITCTAALQLFERGLFRLEDPLCEYISEFSNMTVRTATGIVPAKNVIKIKDLFTMSAGFSYDQVGWTEEIKTNPGKYSTLDAIRLLAKDPLYYEPGTRFRYSFCHDVLPALIEVLTGRKFSEYVDENVFRPLGMKNTTFAHKRVPSDEIAALHTFKNGRAQVSEKKNGFILAPGYESGGAGCISTVDDYILFLEALRKGDILISKETTDLMTTNYITEEMLANSTEGVNRALVVGYGYGLGVRCPKNGMTYTDFGWGSAAGAYCAIDRANNISVFLAEHILGSPSDDLRLEIITKIKNDLGL